MGPLRRRCGTGLHRSAAARPTAGCRPCGKFGVPNFIVRGVRDRAGRRFRLAVWAMACAGLLLAGCAASNAEEDGAGPSDERPLVLTTFTVVADIAQHVAGDHLRVESIIPFGAEVHSYEPTPGDLRTATDAQLV